MYRFNLTYVIVFFYTGSIRGASRAINVLLIYSVSIQNRSEEYGNVYFIRGETMNYDLLLNLLKTKPYTHVF